MKLSDMKLADGTPVTDIEVGATVYYLNRHIAVVDTIEFYGARGVLPINTRCDSGALITKDGNMIELERCYVSRDAAYEELLRRVTAECESIIGKVKADYEAGKQ